MIIDVLFSNKFQRIGLITPNKMLVTDYLFNIINQHLFRSNKIIIRLRSIRSSSPLSELLNFSTLNFRPQKNGSLMRRATKVPSGRATLYDG